MRKTLYVIAIALMISTVTGIYDPNGTQTNCETDEPCVMTKQQISHRQIQPMKQ